MLEHGCEVGLARGESQGYSAWDAASSRGAEIVTGSTADNQEETALAPSTVADVLRGVEPMGDLSKFAIDDLTPDEEDVFFEILEDA